MRIKRFPWRLFSRIVAIQSISVLIALAASGIAARVFFKRQFLSQVENQLHISLGGLSRALPSLVLPEWCSTHSYDRTFRLTVISIDGKVLCDSHHETQTMENHLSRPEVQTALLSQFGQTIRLSSTLGETMFYGALFVKERHVILRGAIPLSNLNATLRVLDTSLALFLLTMALVLSGFGVWSGRKLAFPIGRILHKAESVANTAQELEDLEVHEEPYGELSELESSLDKIYRELKVKGESLNRERQEQATLMGAISDAILAVDSDGFPLFYNSRFAVVFGGKVSLPDGKTQLWELFRDPEILDAFRAALKEGNTSQVNSIRLVQGTGQKFFSLSVSPLRRSSLSEIYGAVGVFHDVSELKLAEQMRIDFVANVSHELRTPLTAIKGYAATLGQDIQAGKPASAEFIEVINRNTERLMSLINDLLDLSSLESNVEDLQKTEVDTEEISKRVIGQLSAAIEAKKQKISVEPKIQSILADPRRLEQVLVNLLDNASKYTPSGGLIRLVWEKDELTHRSLIKVMDSGPGIPFEHHGRLFERFYRVDKARSRELGGTGLGLAIVKHIMQRHSGSVWIESIVGKGSTFICSFPAKHQR